MDTKSLRVEIKDAEKGEISAIFATFNTVDLDGDVTLPGAFAEGAPVTISAYGHKSWEGKLPVGRGVIHTDATKAWFEGHFFLDTTEGADTFKTVNHLKDLQEFSYGYDAEEYSYGEHDGRQVRFLKKQLVHEVSPVLRGAGIGTRVLSMKNRSADPSARAVKRAIPVHETAVASRTWDQVKTQAALPDDARPSQLRTVYAWVDPDGDPEVKASYRFPHHHGIDGPANIRACVAGIAQLNGAKGASLPDEDRRGIYDHLAAHLRDADREPPELRDRSAGSAKSLTLHEELGEVLASVSGVIESATRVVALRREKGKGLSRVNAELLDWIGDELKQLHALLANPTAVDDGPTDDEVASVVMGALARIHGI